MYYTYYIYLDLPGSCFFALSLKGRNFRSKFQDTPFVSKIARSEIIKANLPDSKVVSFSPFLARMIYHAQGDKAATHVAELLRIRSGCKTLHTEKNYAPPYLTFPTSINNSDQTTTLLVIGLAFV